MRGNADRLAYLYEQYVDGTCTETELEEFFEYVRMPEMKQALQELAEKHLQRIPPGAGLPAVDWEFMYNSIMQSEQPSAQVTVKKGIVKRLFTRPLVAAAVVVLLVASTGLYFLLTHKPQQDNMKANNRFKNDIPPGSDKAILTLANGASIALHDLDDNSREQLESADMLRLDSGELAYKANGGTHRVTGYNKLTTPRGGQFRLVLPDGSRIWLNAGSSVTYPLTFATGERKVAITGEAYLEVAPNPGKPFKVAVNGLEIIVLGTKFNINAYTNEPVINTTLLEGAVKVRKGGSSCVLKPGEQLQVQPDGDFKLVSDVDTASIVAWKDGMFAFNDEDITSIMRQVNRWYDADIIYETRIPHHFIGTIPRNVQVSKLLTMLELTGRLRFRIEGRKIFVTQP
jgi:ferric-dicitrate binding protein FerR (iron transport regulator)